MTPDFGPNIGSDIDTEIPPLIAVKALKTWFPIKKGILARTWGHVRAVDGVSFTVEKGETLGLVGESGCGKTTLGRTLMGFETPVAGEILFSGKPVSGLKGREKKNLKRRMQFIFQDPQSSLNPRMNVMDIVTEGLEAFGMLQGSREVHAKKLLHEVGLDGDAVYRYPHEFSGGQRQRISIARAISLRPDFVVCDEPVSALDVSVQAQVINLMMDLRDAYGLSYLFISHDLRVVSNIAHRTAVMYLGEIMEIGPTETIVNDPGHPYTRALISAVPAPGISNPQDRIILSGDIPSPAAPPSGCRFHTRCPDAQDICKKETPPEIELENRRVRCHFFGR